MDVSKNGGTQQPWVFLLKMIILGCFGGIPIFGNTYIGFVSPCILFVAVRIILLPHGDWQWQTAAEGLETATCCSRCCSQCFTVQNDLTSPSVFVVLNFKVIFQTSRLQISQGLSHQPAFVKMSKDDNLIINMGIAWSSWCVIPPFEAIFFWYMSQCQCEHQLSYEKITLPWVYTTLSTLQNIYSRYIMIYLPTHWTLPFLVDPKKNHGRQMTHSNFHKTPRPVRSEMLASLVGSLGSPTVLQWSECSINKGLVGSSVFSSVCLCDFIAPIPRCFFF